MIEEKVLVSHYKADLIEALQVFGSFFGLVSAFWNAFLILLNIHYKNK
jgi:hypothetical protein